MQVGIEHQVLKTTTFKTASKDSLEFSEVLWIVGFKREGTIVGTYASRDIVWVNSLRILLCEKTSVTHTETKNIPIFLSNHITAKSLTCITLTWNNSC